MRIMFSLLLLATTLVPAQDFEPKPARSEFDLASFQQRPDNDLPPFPGTRRGSLRKRGEPTRVIHGRVVDHEHVPVVGVLVGYSAQSMHGYDENFDITDEQGRFLVEGDPVRDGLAIWRAGQRWNVLLKRDKTKFELKWPAPATCSVTLDESFLNDDRFGAKLTLSTTRNRFDAPSQEWALNITEDGPTVIKNLLPGEYSVQLPKTVSLGGDEPEISTSPVEIARFKIEAGQSIQVQAKPNGLRRLSGQLQPGRIPLPFGSYALDADDLERLKPWLEEVKVEDATVKEDNRERMFVEVRQQKATYEQTSELVDFLVTDKNLRFETGPLPPGRYLLTFVGRTPKPVPNNEGDQGLGWWSQPPQPTRMRFRVVIPEANEPVKWSVPESSLAFRMQQALDADPRRVQMNVSFSMNDWEASQIARVKNSTPELLRLLKDPNTPAHWQATVIKAISYNANDAKVVRELIRIAKGTKDPGRRSWMVSETLERSRFCHEDIADLIESFRKDPHFATRYTAYRILPGHITNKNRDQVTPRMIEGLSDAWPRTREEIAAWLGRTRGSVALPELRRLAKEDPSAAVRVTAAHAVAKLTGETTKAIQLMTVVLNGNTYCGQYEAARLLAEYQELPAITIRTLKRKAKPAVDSEPGISDPFSYDNDDNRIRREAKSTLEKIALGPPSDHAGFDR